MCSAGEPGALRQQFLDLRVAAMSMTRLGRAYVLAGQLNDEVSRALPDWEQIATDSAELQRIADAPAALSPPRT